jgi:predicted ester cyclase
MQLNKALCLIVAVSSLWMLAATPAEQVKPAATPNQAVIPSQPAPATQNKPAPIPTRNLPASTEQNKAVVQRVFTDLFNHGRYEAISQLYTPDCVVHHGGKNSRLEESVAEGKGWRMASPDLQMISESIQANGDFVMVQWTAQGTHSGHGNGLQPSGKRFMLHGSSRFRMVNGKIAEVWNEYDRDNLFRQLGVPPRVGDLYIMGQEFLVAVDRFFTTSQGGISAPR